MKSESRPCSVRQSIKQSCKEVKKMREGEKPIRSLSALFERVEKWKTEGIK